MAITLTLEFSLKIGKQPAFLKLLKTGVGAATRAFDGCIKVEPFAETNETSVFLLEQWETRKQQETYSQWRLDNGLMELIGPYLSGPPVRKYYEAING
jgi:quinol monooxygenase YgiN